MIHVPDVGATIKWYQKIGFILVCQNEVDGIIDWARLSYANSEIMFTLGGKTSAASRREVDLYILTDAIDELHETLTSKAEVIEAPHETFYGMREFIIRDLNGFWITFGQPIQ